jgi:5'-nucleotidase/UDP-sugar diphosphatase
MRACHPRTGWLLRMALVLAGWAGCGESLARPIDITVIYTTDLHGHLLPTSDYDGHQDVGGLLRCATRIEELRSQKANVLLVDSGDLIQGSAVSFLTEGRSTIKAMEYLRFDAWTLGNHEFDWGLPKLLALHDATQLPMLAANIVGRPGKPSPLTRVQPFIIREFEGVRVAVVGLITPGVPTWSTPDLLGDALFERSVAALRRIMPAVQAAQPDILLLTTHQGYRQYGDDHANEINAIADAFPEFDAILGGHSHQPVERALVGGHTLYSQAGYYGIWLGQLDLTYDTVRRRLSQKQARLHRISSDIPLHTGLTAVVQADIDRAQVYLDRVVGEAADRLDFASDALGRSDVQRLICRALAESTGAELVLHGILDEEILPAGPLRMSDVWRIVPYENRAALMLVTPSEMLEILNENLLRRGNLQFMGAYGFAYDIEEQGGVRRAVRLRLADGSSPHPRQRLKLCVNSYVVASGGKRFNRLREIAELPETRLQLLPVDTRSAVVDYLKAHKPVTRELLRKGEL